MNRRQMVRKTLLLDPDKLQKLFKTDHESEAVRQAIDEVLSYNDALRAARRIQRRGKFGRP